MIVASLKYLRKSSAWGNVGEDAAGVSLELRSLPECLSKAPFSDPMG